jgi:hypothetical protein
VDKTAELRRLAAAYVQKILKGAQRNSLHFSVAAASLIKVAHSVG